MFEMFKAVKPPTNKAVRLPTDKTGIVTLMYQGASGCFFFQDSTLVFYIINLCWSEVPRALQASPSSTFLQALPKLVMPFMGHSLSPRSCPLMLLAHS